MGFPPLFTMTSSLTVAPPPFSFTSAHPLSCASARLTKSRETFSAFFFE
jgi:hypothetical protein